MPGAARAFPWHLSDVDIGPSMWLLGAVFDWSIVVAIRADGGPKFSEQLRRRSDLNSEKKVTQMMSKEEVPFDGHHKELFADGSLSGEGPMKGGKRHGRWTWYYKSGQRKALGKYSNGDLDGHWEWWRDNGKLLQTGAFSNGVQVGPWKRFYDNGQLWDEGTYEAGKKVGTWTVYTKTGELKEKKTVKPR